MCESKIFFKKTFDIGDLEVKSLASELTSKRADGAELNTILTRTPCRHYKATAEKGPQRPHQRRSRKKKFGSFLAERESRAAAPNGDGTTSRSISKPTQHQHFRFRFHHLVQAIVTSSTFLLRSRNQEAGQRLIR